MLLLQRNEESSCSASNMARSSSSLVSQSTAAEIPSTSTLEAKTGILEMLLSLAALVASPLSLSRLHLHCRSNRKLLNSNICQNELTSFYLHSGGTESIAITAGETKDPAKNLPRVVRNVFWRIILFYILSILIVGLNVPYNYPKLSSGDTSTSPFTIVFVQAGSNVAGSFINAVIMTSAISAANHALFAGSRLLYTLAVDGYAPRFFGELNRFKIPWVAVLATSSVSGLCFGVSYIGAGQVWSWLQKWVSPQPKFSISF